MEFSAFKNSLHNQQPAAEWSVYLKALWYDGKGNWDRAHELIQDLTDSHSAWIHAYLHRKEGDSWNADYWYRRAGRTRPSTSLEEEWSAILTELLQADFYPH